MAAELREGAAHVAQELQRDFEETCLAIASDLAASDDPTRLLELVMTLCDKATFGLTAELQQRLDREFLPQVVQLLLTKSFDLRAVEGVNTFFQWTLATIASRVQQRDVCHLLCLTRILEAHRRFYLYHGKSGDKNSLTQLGEKNPNWEFALRDKIGYTSRYFVLNLEYWGQVGGFALFLDLLHHQNTTFEQLQLVLRTMYAVKDYVSPPFLGGYFPKLVDSVSDFVQNVPSAEFHKLSRDSLMEVVQIAELLLVKVQHDFDAFGGQNLLLRQLCEQRVQLLRLEISLRFFRASQLEKRIYGLTEIVVVVTRLYNDQIQLQPEPTATSLFATLSFLVDWMHEKQLVQELFGHKMHVELVKRSTSLFQFVSELECLPTEWLDLLWSCYHAETESGAQAVETQPLRPTQQRHEAFRGTIHDLMLEMVEFMELPSLNHVLSRIEAVQANLDANQLGLLSAIAARKIFLEEGTPPAKLSLRQRILTHLWTAVLPSVKTEDFRDEILLRMHEMLRLEVEIDEGKEDEEAGKAKCASRCSIVDEYLRQCLSSISQRKYLVTSLKMITQLATLVSEAGIIHDSSYKFVPVVLDEINEYKRSLRQELQATEWPHICDEERTKLPALRDHVNEIKTRLLALRASWILDERGNTGNTSFVIEQMDAVWELMVVDAFLLDEAALCFQWIELCMNTPARGSRQEKESPYSARALMPLTITKYLLMTKFRALAGDCITLSTLCCFHSIFRRVNLVEGGLDIFAAITTGGANSSVLSSPTSATSADGEKEESVELLTGIPLVGLDELWQLAVAATDSAVAEEIITLLVSYHLAFSPGVRHSELPFLSKMHFLEKCMEFITTAKANAEHSSVGSDQQDANYSSRTDAEVAVVNRCVDLLRYFLEACSVRDSLTEREDEEALMKKMEAEETPVVPETDDEGNEGTRNKAFRLEHLEERLPYLEIFPSPIKEMQPNRAVGSKHGCRLGRRPSWTFRQQHALLDVIMDANEDTDMEEFEATGEEYVSTDSTLSERGIPPLKIDAVANLLKSESPHKSGTHSPYGRANLRWPQMPSPQRGPHLKSEEIDRALADEGEGQECCPPYDNDAAAKPKTKYGLMSQILANQGSHFEVLLELVDWRETTSQRTWDLLCRLPTNNELLRKMIRLRPLKNDRESDVAKAASAVEEDINWSDLLDGSNLHRLLYSLRLVEALLIPYDAENTGDQKSDAGRRQWRERFVRLGGAKHLYETLLKWPKERAREFSTGNNSILSQYDQNLRATCLAAVMRVLNYFFHWLQSTALQDREPSPFDLRLRCSTLPEFVKSIDLFPMLQVALQLSLQFCSRKSQPSPSFSDEDAETVVCGVQMCCSLIRFSPELTSTVFKLESSNDSDTIDAYNDYITIHGWLRALLVECPSKATRAQLLDMLSEMATAFSRMHEQSSSWAFFELLTVSSCELVTGDSPNEIHHGKDFDELFTFCRVLLGSYDRGQASPKPASNRASEAISAALIKRHIPGRLVRTLKQIVDKEETSACSSDIRPPRNPYESTLSGYLQLLSLIAGISEKLRTIVLRYNPNGSPDQDLEFSKSSDDKQLMIDFILRHLLFGGMSEESDKPSSPICKTRSTRTMAQQFLLKLIFLHTLEEAEDPAADNSLSDQNAEIRTMLRHLRGYQARVLNTVNLAGRQWNNAPEDALLDSAKNIHHVGLVNPGCICYMNALIQQLFMMPNFCRGLLALDCSQAATNKDSSSWKEEVEQLQKLFVALAFTSYRSSDPTSFAFSHKDMDGESTDVHVQMDADEFFALLLDRVEMFIRPQASSITEDGVKDTVGKDFMERCFGGVLVNQILTQQGNLSEREEKFFALSVEVSKKRRLTESLALYVEGESLEGENAYFCERVQRKVSATKRVCIKKLPQTLICHLKRFEFDYSTMEKMKINDYMEFPAELDMYPYTSEGLASTDKNKRDEAKRQDKSIVYDLVGVVVHSGTSDTGHYYSFIKDRRETENQRWLEFNDEVVREFDVETMGEECFGGEEVAQTWDPIHGAYTPAVHMKRRSAYMLIYERRPMQDDSVPESKAITTSSTVELSSQVKALIAQIRRENVRYESVVNAFDPAYEQFICDLVENTTRLSAKCTPGAIRQTYQVGCQFLFGINSLRYQNPSVLVSPSGSQPEALTHFEVSTNVSAWLSSYDRCACDPDTMNEERVRISKWILAEVVAPPSPLPSSPSSQVESQRTWLFDVLFLSAVSPELTQSCFRILLAAVNILKYQAAKEDASAEQSLLAFFRDLLNLFYDREANLAIRDPVSGSILTLSVDTRVVVMKQLGLFLKKCIGRAPTCNDQGSYDAELCVIRRLLLDKLQFLSRFLLCLRTPCEGLNIATSGTSMPSQGYGDHLRFCTARLEMNMVTYLLESQHEPTPLAVDDTMLLNQSAMKNVLLLGLEQSFVPILSRIAFESEAKRDRLVALLISVLEEVRSNYAEQLLVVLRALLDAEEARAKTSNARDGYHLSRSAWPIHRHIFSPSRGILESAAYYRDRHALHQYIFLLLEFVVHHASKSPVLQEIFKSDVEFHNHIDWIPNWLVNYLDANGAIREQMKAQVAAEDSELTDKKMDVAKEVQTLFMEMENAFGVELPRVNNDSSAHAAKQAQEDQQQVLTSSQASFDTVDVEDVVLEALDLEEENQSRLQEDKKNSRARKMDHDETGPEHDGTEGNTQNWKPHRSREELAALLHIDLDMTRNTAREA